jgi:hypothetical protein
MLRKTPRHRGREREPSSVLGEGMQHAAREDGLVGGAVNLLNQDVDHVRAQRQVRRGRPLLGDADGLG